MGHMHDTQDTLTTVCQRASDFIIEARAAHEFLTEYCSDRKHPFLIDLKFSKNSGMIVYCCRTFCRNFKIFNETGKYFFLIQ
jgi:hypothetical protein